ncbi:hypothetical protein [Stenotrophomonas rhizophila]
MQTYLNIATSRPGNGASFRACGLALLSACLLAACADATPPLELGPEEVALATYRVGSTQGRDAFFALSRNMGEERRAIERNWRIHKKEIEAVLESDTPVLTQRFYEDAVAGVAVDPRLRGQVGDLMRAIMKLRMIADCRTTGATPLEPADNGNLRVSVALECKHPEWTAPQDEGFAALSATERMERIVESVRRGADGPRTGISTSSLKLEQQVKAGRKVWVVDQGRETNEALGSMVDGTLQTFDVPMKLASALLRAESIRVFESTPWERLPADGLGPQRVAIMALNANNRVEKEGFLAYWTAVGKSKAEVERKLWPAAVDKRRALVPQKNWVEKSGGRHWPIFEASLKALESAVCEAGDVEFTVANVPYRRHVASMEMRCEVPTLRYLPEMGWSVNTNQTVPARMSSPLHVNYENVNGAKRWVADEHSVAWITAALFKAIYVPAARGPTGLHLGDDPCADLLRLDGGDPDTAECR